ncbi:MAG: hypothetical protein ACLSAF_07750 [Intestinimonas sp.]
MRAEKARRRGFLQHLRTSTGTPTSSDAELAKQAELGEDGKVPAAQLRPWILTRRAAPRAGADGLSGHTGDNVRHLTAAGRTAWNAKAAGDHTHTAAQSGGRCPRPGR